MPRTNCASVRAVAAVTALLLILQISAVPNDAHRCERGVVGRKLKDDGLTAATTAYPGNVGYCRSSTVTNCPIYKISYYCTAGNAVNGCRLYSEGPFTADCTKQCITKPSACSTDIVMNSPCDDYSYWCTSGQEQGHCQAGTPFNPNKCDTQCRKLPTPKVCTNQTIINNNKCPGGGDGYYICTVGLEGGPTPETWGCRPTTLGPHYPEDCDVQCLGPAKTPSPSPAPKHDFTCKVQVYYTQPWNTPELGSTSSVNLYITKTSGKVVPYGWTFQMYNPDYTGPMALVKPDKSAAWNVQLTDYRDHKITGVASLDWQTLDKAMVNLGMMCGSHGSFVPTTFEINGVPCDIEEVSQPPRGL